MLTRPGCCSSTRHYRQLDEPLLLFLSATLPPARWRDGCSRRHGLAQPRPVTKERGGGRGQKGRDERVIGSEDSAAGLNCWDA